MKTIRVKTRSRIEMIDVTLEVQRVVSSGRIREGLCVVYCPHTTASVTVNEHADPDVAEGEEPQQLAIAPQLGRVQRLPPAWPQLERRGRPRLIHTMRGTGYLVGEAPPPAREPRRRRRPPRSTPRW